jgi:hypothetical protein
LGLLRQPAFSAPNGDDHVTEIDVGIHRSADRVAHNHASHEQLRPSAIGTFGRASEGFESLSLLAQVFSNPPASVAFERLPEGKTLRR